MAFHFRRLVDGQQHIVMEVALIHRTLAESDFQLAGAERIHHRTFNLVRGATEVDHRAHRF